MAIYHEGTKCTKNKKNGNNKFVVGYEHLRDLRAFVVNRRRS